jgi:hypothetical protein
VGTWIQTSDLTVPNRVLRWTKRGRRGLPECPHDCPCGPPKQRLQSQCQPNRLIGEVTGNEGFARKTEGGREAVFRLDKPAYAARWKPSIWRIQLVSGFHLGKIWATNLRSQFRRRLPTIASQKFQATRRWALTARFELRLASQPGARFRPGMLARRSLSLSKPPEIARLAISHSHSIHCGSVFWYASAASRLH